MSNRRRQPRRQMRYPGGRMFFGAGFIPSLEEAIRKDMVRYNVSRSFVIASAVGYAYNIDEQEHFDKLNVVKKVVPLKQDAPRLKYA